MKSHLNGRLLAIDHNGTVAINYMIIWLYEGVPVSVVIVLTRSLFVEILKFCIIGQFVRGIYRDQASMCQIMLWEYCAWEYEMEKCPKILDTSLLIRQFLGKGAMTAFNGRII